MKLYQYRIRSHYYKDYNGIHYKDIYYDLEEKITEVRETNKMYICKEGNLLGYGLQIHKEDIDKIYDNIYSSLSPARDKAIEAFIDVYNHYKTEILDDLDRNQVILDTLEELKHGTN